MEITSDNQINDNIKIFRTLRDIISMYLDLMPLIHEDLLRSVPQQAGNNPLLLDHSCT